MFKKKFLKELLSFHRNQKYEIIPLKEVPSRFSENCRWTVVWYTHICAQHWRWLIFWVCYSRASKECVLWISWFRVSVWTWWCVFVKCTLFHSSNEKIFWKCEYEYWIFALKEKKNPSNGQRTANSCLNVRFVETACSNNTTV